MMNEYEVLIAFEQYEKGDVVKMNKRQAKYLIMDEKLKLKVQKSVKKVKSNG